MLHNSRPSFLNSGVFYDTECKGAENDTRFGSTQNCKQVEGMYGARVCAWASDEEYNCLVVEAESRGHIPSPRRRAPPPPSHFLPPTSRPSQGGWYGHFIQPVPRRPAPELWTPDHQVAKKVVGTIVNRVLAVEVCEINILPGAAQDSLLAGFSFYKMRKGDWEKRSRTIRVK